MATSSDDFTIGMKTERMTEMGLSFKKTGTLLAAVELDLFTHISGGAETTEQLATATQLSAEKIDRLLIACKSLRLIREVGGRYENFSDVERYLVKNSRTYFGDYLTWIARRDYEEWQNIAAHLTAGDGERDGAIGERDERQYLKFMEDPEQARKFTVSGYEASIALAHKLAKEFDFSRYRHWLDLGGGSGCYAIAACERFPDIQVTLMDQANVVIVADEFIAKHDLQDRITTTAGNFLEADYPPGLRPYFIYHPAAGLYAR